MPSFFVQIYKLLFMLTQSFFQNILFIGLETTKPYFKSRRSGATAEKRKYDFQMQKLWGQCVVQSGET